MALRVEPEVAVELLELLPKHRHFLGRNAQRLAGPKARVDADTDDLVALFERNDHEIERNTAVNGRLALGLGHQRHFAARLEIAHGAEASALVRRRSRDAENTERIGRSLVGLLDVITEQGHSAIGEPVE